MTQPGYDALARLYADTFPDAYLTPLEQHTMHAFADLVAVTGPDGQIADVGCGLGHITADLARFGRPVIGVDPSTHMLSLAREAHPECEFACDDAFLDSLAPDRPIAAIVARFSLIHVPPDTAARVLARWSARIQPGGLLLVATQCADDEPVVEFDHAVAPAWRWHPDHLAETVRDAGFDELWRVVARPDGELHRFAEVHLAARQARRTPQS